MRALDFAAMVVLAVLLTACGGASSPPTDVRASPSDDGSASATATDSAAASATASDRGNGGPGAAPAELAGTWRRVVLGETVLLTLDGTGYNIQRAGNFGSGAIEVIGDRIRFFNSTLCDGEGVYTWAFEDDRLRLTEVEADPCSGRTDVLLRGTFGRVDS